MINTIMMIQHTLQSLKKIRDTRAGEKSKGQIYEDGRRKRERFITYFLL